MLLSDENSRRGKDSSLCETVQESVDDCRTLDNSVDERQVYCDKVEAIVAILEVTRTKTGQARSVI